MYQHITYINMMYKTQHVRQASYLYLSQLTTLL